MSRYPTPTPAEPPSEPKPSPAGSDAQSKSRLVVTMGAHGTHRIYVARLGPLGSILATLAIVLVFVAIFVLLLGAVLIWAFLAGLVIAAAIVFVFLARADRRRS
jgi:hypothetical protein